MTMGAKRGEKEFPFLTVHKTLAEVLTDHKLAALGDAYVNFAYSLAVSNKKMQPSGAKVRGHVLAEALKKAGLRECLPSRMSRHTLADAAEALIVYAWLQDCITLAECVEVLEKAEDSVDAFSQLLTKVKNMAKF
jgi:uncharacterized protein YfaQ (DUF2300 family)